MEEMEWLEAEDLHLFGELGPLLVLREDVAAAISSSEPEESKALEATAEGSDSFLENNIWLFSFEFFLKTNVNVWYIFYVSWVGRSVIN